MTEEYGPENIYSEDFINNLMEHENGAWLHDGRKYPDEGHTSVGYGYNLTANEDQARKHFSELKKADPTAPSYDDVLDGNAAITQEQGRFLLEKYLPTAAKDATKFIPDILDHPEPVRDAMVNLAYQLGYNKLSKWKQTKKHIQNKEYDKAADEVARPVKGEGFNKWYRQSGRRANDIMSWIREGSTAEQQEDPTPEIDTAPIEDIIEPAPVPVQDAVPEEQGDPDIINLEEAPQKLLASNTSIEQDLATYEPDPYTIQEPEEEPVLEPDLSTIQEPEEPVLEPDLSTIEEPVIEPDLSTIEEPKEEIGLGEGMLAHAAQGITFGTGENLAAAASTLGYWLGSEGDIDIGATFDRYKKQEREEIAQFAEERPKTAMAMDIIGGIATSTLLPGSGMLKGATTKAKVARAAGQGAAEGAFAGYGYSEDGEELHGITYGALLGGGLSAGVTAAAAKVKAYKAGKELAEDSVEKAVHKLSEDSLLREGDLAGKGLFSRAEEKAFVNQANDRIVFDAMKDIDLNKALIDGPEEFGQQLAKVDMGDAGTALDVYKNNVQKSGNLMSRNVKEAQKEVWEGGEARAQILRNRDEQAKALLDKKVNTDPIDEITSVGDVDPGIEGTLDAPTDEVLAAAYSDFRTEAIRYMRFVTDSSYRRRGYDLSKGRAVSKSIQDIAAEYDVRISKAVSPEEVAGLEYKKGEAISRAEEEMTRLLSKYKEAQKKGVADFDSYTAYKQTQYLGEAIGDIKDEYVAKSLKRYSAEELADMPDTTKRLQEEFDNIVSKDISTLKKKFYETNIMFRQIDKDSGLDLEILQNNAYEATNVKGVWEAKHMSRLSDYAKMKKVYPDEQVYDVMDKLRKGDPVDVPSDMLPQINKLREITRALYESSVSEGMDIKFAGQDYLPRRKKTGAAYVRAMEDFYESTFSKLPSDQQNAVIKKVLKATDEEMKDILKASSMDQRQVIGFLFEVDKHVKGNLDVEGIASIFRTKELRKPRSMSKLLEADAGALHKRNDRMPEFLVDKNIPRVLQRNVTEASKLIYLEPLARQLDGRASILRSMGRTEAADAVANYRKDLMGQYRKGLAKIDAGWKERLRLEYGDKTIDTLDEFFNFSINAIYPNLVGLNPAGWARNLLQPIYKTLPEMGYWNPVEVTKAYGRAFKKLVSKTEVQALKERGILGSDDLQDLMTDLPERMGAAKGKTAAFIQRWNHYAMSVFNYTDKINRVVTAELSDKLTTDILTSKTDDAMKAMQHFPAQLKSQAIRAMRGTYPEDQLRRNIRNHFEVQTQLAYGKVGNSEFVRDNGRLASMMTKWPVAIGSDIADTFSGDKALREKVARFSTKYLGPALLASLGSMSLRPEEGEEADPMLTLLLGNEYGGNFDPLETMYNINFTSPLISGLSKGSSGLAELGTGLVLQDQEKVRRGVKGAVSAMTQFIPVIGGAWKAADKVSGVLETDRPLNILIPEEYEYESDY